MTENDKLIQQWQEAKAALDGWKKEESRLRKEVIAANFKEEVGTQKLDLNNGYKLHTARSTTYTLDNEDEAAHIALAKLNPELAGRLVNWKPSLHVETYKCLCADDKVIIDAVLTTKFGAPTLKIIEPKE